MSDFTQRTRSYPDARLFEIVREAEKYAAEAVVAAEVEIGRRGLNSEDFTPEEPSKPFAKVGKLVSVLTRPLSPERPDDVIDWVEEPEVEDIAGIKYLLYLMIVIGLIGLSEVYNQMDYILFAFGPDSYGFDTIVFSLILGLLFQALIVYLLWIRKRIGYYITAGFAASAIIGHLISAPYFFQESDNDLLDLINLTTEIDPASFLIGFGLTLATIWLVTRRALMDIFNISQKGLIITLAIGAAFSFAVNFMYILF